MARLIEVDNIGDLPARLTLKAGDGLMFAASGGHIRSGAEVVQIIGPFLSAVLGTNGEIVSPMGPPNAIIFLAHHPGGATIDVVTGDPFHAPHTTPLHLTVEP